jgi:uncharacterized protein (TIGR00369 family)
MNDAYDPLAAENPYPLQEHLGFRLVQWTDGFARVELPLAPHLMNRYGIPHGGVYATLLDTACGYSGSYCDIPGQKRLAMTLSLTVNFLARPEGELLIAEARRTGGGRRTFFAEGRISDETGTLTATASGTFRYRDSQQ